MDSGDWVTLTDAARLVKRTRRALEKWATAGMPTVKYHRQQYVQMRHVYQWAVEHGRTKLSPKIG